MTSIARSWLTQYSIERWINWFTPCLGLCLLFSPWIKLPFLVWVEVIEGCHESWGPGDWSEIFLSGLAMECLDGALTCNSDWDPMYLSEIFSQDFFVLIICGQVIVCPRPHSCVETIKRYNPLVEDISLDDETLCQAVEEMSTNTSKQKWLF